jgi:predicted GNAT family N-acyltransferase
MGVEDDLGAGLMPYEALRDDVGVVTGLYHRDKLVATMRFVPSGYRLTAAERLGSSVAKLPEVARAGSWEVGRLIVAPDERSPELLHRCLALSLRALARRNEIAGFYAIATFSMARLWRRFGMHPVATLTGASGKTFLLVAGALPDVSAALEVPSTAFQISDDTVDNERQFDTFVPAKRRVPAAAVAIEAGSPAN